MSAEQNKAIEDMDHEELVAALPKLREEAARTDARVHAAADRLAETAEVPTYVEVHGDHLVHLPGVRFYDVHGHRDKTIVIRLEDETYDRLIVEVPDPAEVVAKINDAVGASPRS